MSDVVGYEVRGRKAYLTLNRPDRLNAIAMDTGRLIKDLVDRAKRMLLTGVTIDGKTAAELRSADPRRRPKYPPRQISTRCERQ